MQRDDDNDWQFLENLKSILFVTVVIHTHIE